MAIPMNRAVQFLRSLLPADPRQLLFIIGLVCLTVAPSLNWLSSDIRTFVQGRANAGHTSNEILRSWFFFAQFAFYGLIFAASAGFFACCWPGKHPVRRIFWLVLLPAFAGLSTICFRYLSLLASPRSVLQRGTAFDHGLAWAIVQLTHLGTAFHFCFAGLLLVTIFVLLLIRNKTSLPISISRQTTETPAESDGWRGCKRLIWLFQGAPALTSIPLNVISLLLLLIPAGRAVPWQYQASKALAPTAEGLVFFTIAVWAMGKGNWNFIRQQIRVPASQYAGFGLAIPVAAAWLPALVLYLHDRADWAAHAFGRLEPPPFRDYFSAPEIWMAALFLGAFAEEVIFRGVLQRHFIERFGLWRGICFVGIIWAAFHFYGDARFRLDDLGVVNGVAARLITCTTHGFVLSWLSLRSKSLLPSTFAHALYNAFVDSKTVLTFPGEYWVHLSLWGIAAYYLFRCWPLQTEPPREQQLAEPGIEPA